MPGNQVARRTPNRGAAARNGLFTPATLNAAVRVVQSAARAGAKYMSGRNARSGAKPRTAGGNYAKVPKGKGPNIPVRKSKRYSGPSRSGGKFTAAKKSRDPFGVYMAKGVMKTLESNTSMTNTDVVYIGHSTRVAHQEFAIVMRALLKSLFFQDSSYVPTFEATASIGVLAQLTIRYYLNPLTATLSTLTVPIALADTFETITGNLITGMLTLVDLAGGVQMNFESLTLDKLIGAVYIRFAFIDLTATKIHQHCVSTLKIQNRTTNVDDDDIDVVDNLPLHGKVYEGNGNAAIHKGTRITPYTPFTASESNGYIKASTSATMPNHLREPPPKNAFQGVKKHGNVSLEPGDIKESKLTSTWKQGFNVWFAELQRIGTGWLNNTYRLSSKGQFRFFGLEKKIGGAADADISIQCELDNKWGCYITHYKHQVTQPTYEKLAVA